ncbi:MAG: hypothetical protein R6U64_04890 [Bacteroidales bacterium]
MNKLVFLLFPALLVLFFACEDDDSSRLELLTTPVWVSDSLLINGTGAGGAGQMLEDFNGEVDFQTDGTVYLGTEPGTWSFLANETQLMLESPELPVPLVLNIIELTETSLKVSTTIPNPENPEESYQIRMTFLAK